MKNNGIIKKCLKVGFSTKVFMAAGILMAGLVVFQNPAEAKMLRGEVVAVKQDGSSFSFKRFKPSQPAATEEFEIMMLPNTKFEKISSLKELAAGDEVVVDAAKKKETGIWEANSIRILKVQLYNETLAPKAQLK